MGISASSSAHLTIRENKMSMYNMLFGVCPFATIVVNALGYPLDYYGRFRDAWIEELEDGSIRFAIYTRNGGGNRECSSDGVFLDCECAGCRMDDIKKDPLYISDKDDDFDSTYATIYLKVPEDFKERILNRFPNLKDDIEGVDLKNFAIPPLDMSQRWQDALEALKNDNSVEGQLIQSSSAD